MSRNSEYPEYPEYQEYKERIDPERAPDDHYEEMSAELTAPYRPIDRTRDLRENAVRTTKSAAKATGWAALILAILSWIIWPVLLGATAVVVGFIAFRQGSRGLGIWSMTLGLIAVAAYLILIPIYYSVT